MDQRCPRKLKDYPEEWCSFAVIRLKSLRNAGKELSEEEENRCPGCHWAIAHQLSSYCFFKFAKDYLQNGISDIEIASLNSVSVDTTKRIEKRAMEKFKKSKMIVEMKNNFRDNEILDGIKEINIEHSIMV